ncbi:Biopolymer transport protein ExbD/TolR [Rosistilla oblonga]|uniref:Biopolymer transport protein ExbD/TolR n=1 Tax=Rosistilla oblonga TaxID=2527990 RepID=A0A518IUQ4_9BACT|nr:biopolymer transporter ExbD [Rosistilla oblonga]QDV15035.1 Biopolymer transport protein ExbD/TolR [Rosistilla oblonga]QDV56819.1 Biopolymer transport protein ExbD/TolR [Rosistilla oblonga]
MSMTCPRCGAQTQGVRCESCGADLPTADAIPVASEPSAAEPIEIEATDDGSDAAEAETVEAAAAEPAATEAHASVETTATAHHHGHAMAEAVNATNFGIEEEVAPDDLQMKGKIRDDSELDMTPMVDVTFLLLIFFMVTASFSLQKSITMPREQSEAPSTNQQDEPEEEIDLVTVQIDEFNSFTVLAADWEREVPGKQNLIRALKEAKPESEARLKIEVHEDAVIEAVVDAMDAGAEVGFSEIQKSEVKG